MKAIRIMLLGIAFILIGIWGMVPAFAGAGSIYYIIYFGFPVIGIVLVIAGLIIGSDIDV